MNGSKFLQILTLLLCAGMLYFSYETYKEAKQIHQESLTIFAKADSLLSTPATKSAAKDFAKTSSKAASFIDELFTDLEKDYKESKKAAAKSTPKVYVSSSYRIEDRYVPHNVHKPDIVGNEVGTVVIDIRVDKTGTVKKTSVNQATTITNEDVIDAARKAALQTNFNYNREAPETQSGTITYTYVKE